MSEIIIGERGTGKTTELIKRSAETGAYILTANKCMARCIYSDAMRMGYTIPLPITIHEYLNGYVDRRIHILIDEFDSVLHSIFNFGNVDAITLTKKEYPDVTYLKRKDNEDMNE